MMDSYHTVLTQQKKPHSRVAPSNRGDNSHTDTIEIDLGIDPVAYRYESWSEMADGWVDSLRSSAATMPDPDHDQIRNVTPLVSLSEVEALVEQLVVAGEVDLPHESTDSLEETSSL